MCAVPPQENEYLPSLTTCSCQWREPKQNPVALLFMYHAFLVNQVVLTPSKSVYSSISLNSLQSSIISMLETRKYKLFAQVFHTIFSQNKHQST